MRVAVDTRQYLFVDSQGEIEADVVRILDRSHRAEAQPDRVTHDEVDRLGVTHATSNQVDRLAPQRVLQAVADEPGHVPLNPDRDLARELQHFERCVHRFGRCVFAADDLDDGDEVRRVPPVHTHSPVGAG